MEVDNELRSDELIPWLQTNGVVTSNALADLCAQTRTISDFSQLQYSKLRSLDIPAEELNCLSKAWVDSAKKVNPLHTIRQAIHKHSLPLTLIDTLELEHGVFSVASLDYVTFTKVAPSLSIGDRTTFEDIYASANPHFVVQTTAAVVAKLVPCPQNAFSTEQLATKASQIFSTIVSKSSEASFMVDVIIHCSALGLFLQEVANSAGRATVCEVIKPNLTVQVQDLILQHPIAYKVLTESTIQKLVSTSPPTPPGHTRQYTKREIALFSLGEECANIANNPSWTAEEKEGYLADLLVTTLHKERKDPVQIALAAYLSEMLASKFELDRQFIQPLKKEGVDLVSMYVQQAISIAHKIHSVELVKNCAGLLDPCLFPRHDPPELPTLGSFTAVTQARMNFASLLVDRQFFKQATDLRQLLIQVLRHRLDLSIVSKACIALGGSASDSGSETSTRSSTVTKVQAIRDKVANLKTKVATNTTKPTVYEILLSLIENSEPSAQEYLLHLLLERRFGIPLVMWRDGTIATTMPALRFVHTAVSISELASIYSNTSMLRVVVLSHREPHQCTTPTIIKNVFACNSLTLLDTCKAVASTLPTLIEAGFGFIPGGQKVVLLLHIIGKYQEALNWLHQNRLVDFVIVEDVPEGSNSFLHCNEISLSYLFLYCPSTNAYEEPEVIEGAPEGAIWLKFVGSIDSPSAAIVKGIHEFMESDKHDLRPLSKDLLENSSLQIRPADLSTHQLITQVQESITAGLKDTNLVNLRTSFKLQHSFQVEAAAELEEAENVLNYMDTKVGKTIMAYKQYREVCKRKDLATAIASLPVISIFIEKIAADSAVERMAFVACLENTIRAAIQPSLHALLADLKKIDKLSEKQRETAATKHQQQLLRLHFALTTCHVEHIWRELSHLYVADPVRFQKLPFHAAQHLLDGCPLELMDGDAGTINIAWVQASLYVLHHMLEATNGRPPHIFVLSILGVQSSGKSTLLNILFGCRFRVSVGMTTRGINMSLIKAEGWNDKYDYIMLLDTEGVHSALQNNKTHDNRLAALALWPADATIVMLNSEDTKALHNILPIVGDAYQGSALADRYMKLQPTQLFFAQRGISHNATDNAGAEQGLKSSWSSELTKNLKTVGVDGMLKGFHSDTDHLFLGNTKVGEIPNDTPNPKYGQRLLKFRETIHKRVATAEWHPRTLLEWVRFVKDLWPAIGNANLALSWESLSQRQAFTEIDNRVEAKVLEVETAYGEAFNALLLNLQKTKDEKRNAIVEESPNITEEEVQRLMVINFQKLMHEQALSAKQDGHRELERLAKQFPEHAGAVELARKKWKVFLDEKTITANQRVYDYIASQLFYEPELLKYKQLVIQACDAWALENPLNGQTKQQNRQQEFAKIFDPILEKLEKQHPPLSRQTATCVRKVFGTVHEISKDMPDLHTNQVSTNDTGEHILHKIYSWIAAKVTSKEARVQEAITGLIDEIKADKEFAVATHYSDNIVRSVIHITLNHLERKRVRADVVRKQVLTIVYDFLVAYLGQLQYQWETNGNSVSYLLRKDRDMLFQEFEARCDNLNTAQRLQKQLQSVVESDMASAYASVIADGVIAELARVDNGIPKHRWALRASSPQMQAIVDSDLLDLLEKGNDQLLISNLVRPGHHYNNLVRKRLQVITDDVLRTRDWWTSLRKNITCAVTDAKVAAMAASSQRRIQVFLDTIMKADGVPGPLVTAIGSLTSLFPVGQDIAPDIFEGIATSVASAIPQSPPREVVATEQAINYVWNEMANHRGGKGLQVRCDASCQYCGIQCALQNNHQGKHDAQHQPCGLCGTHYRGTLVSYDKSCVEIQLQKISFYATKNGVQTLWRHGQWSEVFPEWNVPVRSERLHVRELIFFRKQDLIVKTFTDVKINTNVPESFNHDINKLKRTLQDIIEEKSSLPI